MPLETGVYINSLNSSFPAATDGLADADNHMRLIKSTIKTTFPDITGAVNSTHTELNIVDGDTSATATTLVDADRVVVNDDGTMVQVAMTDVATYVSDNNSISQINSLTYPTADGNNGDVLTTDGAGTLSFAPVTAFTSGMLVPYAGSSAPTGWLLCYGQAVSRTTYADLYAVLGSTYGSGDGSTTFNVPDLRGRVVAGQDDMGGISGNRLTNQSGGLNGDALGATGGSETHSLTTAQLPNNWYHKPNTPGGEYSDNYANFNYQARHIDWPTYRIQGGNGAHNNVQPTIILNYIIKT